MPNTKAVKRQQKKQQKELKRRKRQKQEAVRKVQWQRACRFPKIEIAPNCTAAPEFIDAVYSAAQKVNFNDCDHFDKFDRMVWELVATDGFQLVEQIWKKGNWGLANTLKNSGLFLKALTLTKLAEAVYSQIPAKIKDRFMPHQHFMITPVGKVLQVYCNSLFKKASSGGNIHFSINTPLLESGAEKRPLGFTTHALERICERIAPQWKTKYVQVMDFVRFVVNVPPFETVRLHGGQPAIVLFAVCGNPHSIIHGIYVNEILGRQNFDLNGNDPEYRIGYCPIEFNGPFAVAKTFLLPGYKGTPEYDLLRGSGLGNSEKNRLLTLAKNHVRDHDQAEEWIPLVKWFHENGIPQVRQGAQNYDEILNTRFDERWKVLEPILERCGERRCAN
jgi:hypothetical protein